MEEFLRAALGMHSCDVCGPLESKRTGRESRIANLDNPKMASGGLSRASDLTVISHVLTRMQSN